MKLLVRQELLQNGDLPRADTKPRYEMKALLFKYLVEQILRTKSLNQDKNKEEKSLRQLKQVETRYLIGVDIGTNGCKTILINSEGEIVGTASREYPTYYPRPGWAEQNPEDWYSAFKTAFIKMTREANISPDRISAIGVTGQMVGLTCLDKEGAVLRNTILWNDQRAASQVEWLKKNFKKKIPPITYAPINQSFTLPKILWLREHEPLFWKQMYKLQLPKDYIRFRLTKNWFTDCSDASGTMLFDLSNLKWSQEICEMVQIPLNKLPNVTPSFHIAGHICRKTSNELGIKEDTPVVAGAADLSADNLAAGITEPYQWVTRMGTAGSTSLIVEKPVLDRQEVCFCSAHCIPDKYIVEVGTHTFGLAYRWFKDTFCAEETTTGEEVRKSPYEITEEMIAHTSIGANGLFFHPFIAGSPYWDPQLKGAFLGITPGHKKKHFARALLEGTVFCLSDSLALLRKLTGSQLKEYILVGGGSKSRIWRQIVCDVLGTNALVLEHSDASLGAAMLAGIGSSTFDSVSDAIAKCVKRKLRVSFRRNNHIRYQSMIKDFGKIHREIQHIYSGLGKDITNSTTSNK